MFDIWLRDMVTAGSFALAITDGSPNADPDDVVTQAEAVIADGATLASAFMQPTPDDPLGTAPRYGLTAIGQAIEVARQQRSTDYDWVAVQRLADTSPGRYPPAARRTPARAGPHPAFLGESGTAATQIAAGLN